MFISERSFKQILLSAAMVFSFGYAINAHAATDGDLGEDSTGTSEITVTIPELIKITDVGDITLGTFSGASNMNAFDNVCIFRNNPASPDYIVTATDSNGGADFKVADGGNEIDYQVYWNDATGNRGVQLVYNTASAEQNNANTASPSCAGGTNARFDVEILEADLIAAVPGAYSATLTLFVEPQ
jgi:hypothetical protein